MTRLARFDWKAIETGLDLEGQTVLPGLLSADECDAVIALDANDKAFGDVVQELRAKLYEKLAPIANRWNMTMGSAARYPARLDQLLQVCHKAGQSRPPSAVSRLRKGDHRALRQNAEGDCVFSLQAVLLLGQPGKDFTGGELVMTEQRPRMQTRPMVVPLQKGDATVFAVHYRPFKGTKGYYRVNLRHAVSRVRSGERIAVDLLFHDAP
ncbi:MAG TPA: 2OG-Fe(II) oxygenase [Burkholderiales bacterium]|nr:2OG-Fe(II) oxygenase [Burkholderiales bacterium]